MAFTLSKDVTLVCVDGSDPNTSLQALKFSNRDIGFSNIKLISTNVPELDMSGIEYHQIAPMTWDGYNDFICNKLKDYINTEFCITVQSDGFITDPHLWDDSFFDYDYIGAPWPDDDSWIDLQYEKSRNSYRENNKKARIGNGGFSFRSKKFLSVSSTYQSCMGYGEDTFLCNHNYKSMLESGIVFPDVDIALKFSIENPIKEMGYNWPDSDDNFRTGISFGFHGKYVKDYDHIISKMKNYGR